MAIPVITSHTITTVIGQAISMPIPDGVEVGDLLVVLLGNNDSADNEGWTSAPAGWTVEYNAGGVSTDCYSAMAWRIADGTELATADFNSNPARQIGYYLRITGAIQSNPIVIGTPQLITTVTDTAVMSNFDTAEDDCLLMSFVVQDDDIGVPWSVSGNWVAPVENIYKNGLSVAFTGLNQATAGASEQLTWTSSAPETMVANLFYVIGLFVVPPDPVVLSTTRSRDASLTMNSVASIDMDAGRSRSAGLSIDSVKRSILVADRSRTASLEMQTVNSLIFSANRTRISQLTVHANINDIILTTNRYRETSIVSSKAYSASYNCSVLMDCAIPIPCYVGETEEPTFKFIPLMLSAF